MRYILIAEKTQLVSLSGCCAMSAKENGMAKHALLAGISAYPTDPLAFCVDDAKAMKSMLEMKEYGFDCTVLFDAAVTTKRLKAEIERVLQSGDEGVVIYFAGHAAATEYGAYLCTFDGLSRLDDGFDLSLLSRMINALTKPETPVTIVLDCCHSGSVQLGASQNVALRGEDLVRFLQFSSERRVLLAACRENQYANEDPNLGHGIFTYHVLEGLLGEACNANGEVTANGLYDYVSEAFSKNKTQAPVYRGDLSGRLVLGNGLAPKIQKEQQQTLVVIEQTARDHLRLVQKNLSMSMAQRDEWHASGHLGACQQLAPIIEWFKKRIHEAPNLLARPDFLAAKQELDAKVKSLSTVEPGIRLQCGEILKTLGGGSFGSVWCVRDAKGPTAVKVFHPHELSTADKVSRFSQGFSAMRRLDHPNIVKVHSLFECPLMFSMDFVNGPNLRDWSGSIREPQALLKLLYVVADTLRHAHARGVIHRDVKPENILMAHEGGTEWSPHLTDFDLAWFSTASLSTRDALGTVFYAAPEQLGKPGSAGAHSPTVDVYSFGQLLFFTVTGSDPVPLGMADNVKGLGERLNYWTSPEPVRQVVGLYRDCTNLDPAKRPASMEDVCRRLYKIALLLRQRAPEKVLSPEEFIAEVRFGVTGDYEARHEAVFESPSKMTQVSLELDGKYPRIGFTVSKHPLVDNVSENRRAKAILQERAAEVVREYRACRLEHGRSDPFHFFVHLSMAPLNLELVAFARDLVVRMLGVLEKG